MNNKRVSELITTDTIRTWNTNDIITITAGTGVGKSYFIKNILYAFAKANNRKILMLIHRTNCTNQFLDEIKRDKKIDVIDIRTYQSIENVVLKKGIFDLSQYQYIVSDEFHYFISDASFNITTDISLNKILEESDAIKIFMSATGNYVKNYIKNVQGLDTIDYELPIKYDFIKELTFFNSDNTLENFIDECLEKGNKAIFFIQSAKKAYDLYLKCKDNCIFNCSKSNDDYYKYVDEKQINDMLVNEKFDKNILITTTCMDAGVNIIDEELKHIVIDVEDIGTLIQCLGRKRIQNKDEKIYLYIKSINNKQLGGKETQLNLKIKKADFLREHTVKEYIEEFPRSYDYNNIVYDETIEDEDNCTKKINELMYFKCNCDICDIEIMKTWGEFGYCKYLANKFGFRDEDTGRFTYRLIEEETANCKLEKYLNSIVGKVMLKAKDRRELIEKLNVRSDGHLLKRINNLNGALEEIGLAFRIIEFETSRIINDKKKNYKSAWKVKKLVTE